MSCTERANNILDGRAGTDTMIGDAGDDSYYVDNTGDTITENAGEGWDAVYATASYTLSVNVDALVLMGTGAINATGNTSYNYLVGNSVNNIIDGQVGGDLMVGGAGNDTYSVDNVGDTIVENANEGWDVVWSSIHYALGANVEELRFLWLNRS